MDLVTTLTSGWNDFWFRPGSGLELGVARITIVGYYLVVKLTDRAFDFSAWQDAWTRFAPYWQRPAVFDLLRIPPPSPGAVKILAWTHRIAIFLAVIGLVTPVACGVALLSSLPLLGMRHGLRMHHTVIPIKFCLLGLALSHSGDYLSVDSLLNSPTADPSFYGWGITYLRVLMVIAVFATGVAKVRHAGARWFAPSNLTDLLRIHDFPYIFVKPVFSVSQILRRFPWLAVAISTGVLIMEVGIPASLVWPELRYLFVPAAAAGLIAFRLFLGARFDLFVVILLAVLV